jgi:thiamine biosynthesis lipoprotein
VENMNLKIKQYRYFLVTFFLALISCTNEVKVHQIKSTRLAMGTVVEIIVIDKSEESGKKAIDASFNEINRISNLFYEGNPESAIYAFNYKKDYKVEMPLEVLELVQRSLVVSQKTKGAFDMTMGILLPLYDFKKDSPAPPDPLLIKKLLPYVDYTTLTVDLKNQTLESEYIETSLATGGIVKGYAIDRAIEILKQKQVAGALINAGGDIRAIERDDGDLWRIGIQHPRNPQKILYTIEIAEGAVTTSGDYQKYFIYDGKRIHHILDPGTGMPANSCQAVTVIGSTAELADALATGLFVLGAQEGFNVIKNFPECEALWIRYDGKEYMSEGFKKFISKGKLTAN